MSRSWTWTSVICAACLASLAVAQTELAHINGRVTDPSGAVVVDAELEIKNPGTNLSSTVKTNQDGFYAFPSLRPGHYVLFVRKAGFKTVTVTQFDLNAQDHVTRDFILQIGAANESVTVSADTLNINTTDAAVSTVVDRQFADRLPLNGRSFQSLIELTPGVVLTANNGAETGQFSINGQRDYSNYWMVDGVSANIGFSAAGYVGEGMSGSLGGTNVFGGTNGLVSVDAMQEFRIQTSTYAPEYGRAPGGQISIVTRSGTNNFHGTLYDYFRNDALDANDWFADNAGLPKPEERQNDFGGTLGGPIWKNKTFFFFSYEGLRLRLPRAVEATVPDVNPQDPDSRQYALPEFATYLNAFPLPNGPEVLDQNGNHQGIAQLNVSFSNPASLDAYSIRIDHNFSNKLTLFGRYNNSPSSLAQHELYPGLSSLNSSASNTLTETVGTSWTISPTVVNDLRFNFSRTNNYSSVGPTNFGGATALGALPYPSQYTVKNSSIYFIVGSLLDSVVAEGAAGFNQQRQFNVVDSLSLQKGTHGLKFGVDYRRLSPSVWPGPGQDTASYSLAAIFPDVASAEGLEQNPSTLVLNSYTLPATFLFRNLGLFAQDTWRIVPRLTMTYGLRWDLDFVPSTLAGPNFSAVTGFNLTNLANLAPLPNTPPFNMSYGNVAPRIGLAYQLSQNDRWRRVLRGGFGVFYDLATSEFGNLYSNYNYPFGSSSFAPSVPNPLYFPPLPVAPPSAQNVQALYAVDPHLKLPRTLEWNLSIEQAIGKEQVFTVSYVGASGRDLLAEAYVFGPNPNLTTASLVTNSGGSNYNALQLQFQRHLSAGLQVLASYTWAHSIDTGSGGSSEEISNALPNVNPSINRASSDFDIRHAASAGITYDIPSPVDNVLGRALLRGWSAENLFQARTAPPVDVYWSFATALANGFYTDVRPDVVPGQSYYLYGSQYPGRKAFNANAFMPPPLIPVGCENNPPCSPTRQGDLPRNALRGFGATQWDFALHRDFPLHESVKLQFRAELFNVVNHPNFGQPANNLGSTPPTPAAGFGVANAMLGSFLAGSGSGINGVGAGAFDPLYQIGGPRSIQLALKLLF